MKLFEKSIHNLQHVPVWLRSTIMIFPLGLVLYWTFTFSGLYRFFTHLQMRLNDNGMYEDSMSFIFTFFSMMIPATLVLLYIAYKYYPEKIVQSNADNFIVDTKKTLFQKIGIVSNTQTVWFAVYCFFFGIGSLLIGINAAIFLYNYNISKTPASVDLSNNTIVKDASREYIVTKGYLYCDEIQSFMEISKKDSEIKSRKTDYYIPLYTKAGVFSSIFLQKTVYENPDSNESRLQENLPLPEEPFNCVEASEYTALGIIEDSRLPGLLRDSYLEAGILKEGEAYSILDLNRSNGPAKSSFEWFAVGLVCLVILALLEWKLKLFADKNFENNNPETIKVPSV